MSNSSGTHKVVMLGFPQAQVLDITGPLEVFSRTARWLVDQDYARHLPYKVELVAGQTGPLPMSSGLELHVHRRFDQVQTADTLLVAGGIGYLDASKDPDFLTNLKRLAGKARRVGSICTGSMILARAGLLDHMAATTHWEYLEELEHAGRDVQVDHDAIFVRNGSIFTSAGVTAGMDMALAMVEEDWGQAVALAVAQQLVMYLKRPGGQSQFSNHLKAQSLESGRLQKMQLWMLDNLDQDLRVGQLANRAAMSERTFARRFADEVGVTPARFVEQARVQAARRRLEEGHLQIDSIAQRCGFRSAENMRRSFIRILGVPPTQYRERFQSTRTTGPERAVG
jgi:transcriptional regulator GlxA family with amidase domain